MSPLPVMYTLIKQSLALVALKIVGLQIVGSALCIRVS